MIKNMREMNVSGVDLNLLPPLLALLRRRNVTHAANDAGLSQPAMSRALARLRALLGDPLLVRGNRGYVLTPRAAALLPLLESTLGGVRALLEASTALNREKLDDPFFQGAPCTLLVEDVEAVWAPIAERDDWSDFERKITDIRAMGKLLNAS